MQTEMFKRKPRLPGREDLIITTGTNQQDILKNILILYNKGFPVHLDSTFSRGRAWTGIPGPGIKADLSPAGESLRADATKQPFKDKSIKSAFFDPPFLADARGARMKQYYTAFETLTQLHTMYKKSLKEFKRILSPRGILIFKCQDMCHDHKNEFIHVDVINRARNLGFKIKDLFVSINDRFIVQWNIKKQEHAKKTHSYFLVLQNN